MANHQRPSVSLVLVDLINHFEFPDGKKLLRNAMRIVPPLTRLKRRAKSAGIPVIYVNDNFGHWRSDAKEVISYCTRAEALGRLFVTKFLPDGDDYIVLKPMHSAFFQTPLDTLLRFLGVSSIVLAGIATNSCIVYSGHDAKMRALPFVVASDCCAATTMQEHRQALQHVENITGAGVRASKWIDFGNLKL
jgi:nicotinamidase-related amidase